MGNPKVGSVKQVVLGLLITTHYLKMNLFLTNHCYDYLLIIQICQNRSNQMNHSSDSSPINLTLKYSIKQLIQQ
jgi:hypothetical protein